jgi:hypothetical protein
MDYSGPVLTKHDEEEHMESCFKEQKDQYEFHLKQPQNHCIQKRTLMCHRKTGSGYVNEPLPLIPSLEAKSCCTHDPHTMIPNVN